MRLTVAAVAPALAVGLLVPPAAAAATLAVNPVKSCYRSDPRSGETLALTGTGFTPSGTVAITSDGQQIGTSTANAAGSFAGSLRLRGSLTGERTKTYAARDVTNPALSASVPLRVSALSVDVHPRRTRPGRRVRIDARGFTGARRLYAHVVRGRRSRDVRVGAVRGACGTVHSRVRLFSRSTRLGVYKVQFDARRGYSPRTNVRVLFSLTIFRTFRASATAAGVVADRGRGLW